jgi:hypothetical protein
VRLPPPPQLDVPQANLEPGDGGDGGDSALAQVQDGQQDEGLKIYHVLDLQF